MGSGLFLRGSRCVVASLLPISDFHAPLLAILFHHALSTRKFPRQVDSSEVETSSLNCAALEKSAGRVRVEMRVLCRTLYGPLFAMLAWCEFVIPVSEGKLVFKVQQHEEFWG